MKAAGREMNRMLRAVLRGASGWQQHRRLVRTLNALIAGRKSNLDDIGAFLAARVTPKHLPMVLISQAQRSGGSLLSQLFDGHPALAAYPQELRFGFEYDDVWPPLDPALGVTKNFRMLFDLKFARLMRGGYMKGGAKRLSPRAISVVRSALETNCSQEQSGDS
jgi:hypothetical protein